jgi:hypothetical protein
MEAVMTSAAAAAVERGDLFSFSPPTTGKKEEEQQYENRRSPPKKRVLAFTAFLACLSFLVFIGNLIITFTIKLVDNERMWKHLAMWLNKKRCNNTEIQ